MEHESTVQLPERKTTSASHSHPDLSAEIVRAVDRKPGDRVRCRRVSANTYRCNWLAPDLTDARGGTMFMETYRIRDSKFLRVSKSGGRLVIEDITAQSGHRHSK